MSRPKLAWAANDIPAGYRRLSPRESLEFRAEEAAEEIKKHAREIGEFCRMISADVGKRDFETVGIYVNDLRPWLEDLFYFAQKGIQIEVDLRDLRQEERRDRFGIPQHD
jgi:hypothetical protein